MKTKKIYLATKIWFGKYKGRDLSVYQLINEDLDYMNWALDKVFSEHYIDDRVRAMFNEKWERRNFKRHGFRNDNLNEK